MLGVPLCPNLGRRLCLFGHSSEEVASSSSSVRGSTQQGDNADAPVPQMMEEIEEMIRSVRQELLERIVKEVIDVLVPQVQAAIAKAVKLIQQQRLQQRGVEGLVELPVSQTQEMVIPEEPVPEPISEQIADVPAPQTGETRLGDPAHPASTDVSSHR